MARRKRKKFIIHRAGVPHQERAVLITQGENVWRIDPQAELAKVSIFMSRESCVLSFAAGLKDAGHKVYIKRRFINRRWWRKYLLANHPPKVVVPQYYLLGRACGTGDWVNLAYSLMFHFITNDWVYVFEHTARYYLDRPFYRGEIHLIDPIDL